jgi:crotonobetainyl-CoA:carnitine CoA-transferase CaiB-like acyl-CoA transferase
VLAAVYRRDASGKGEMIDVSMMDASISWNALHIAPWLAGQAEFGRGAGFLNGGYPFYRVYECADGKFISVGALEPQFWQELCRATGHEELIGEQMAPPDRQAEIHSIFEETFRAKPRDEWVAVLSDLDTCVAPVNDFSEMAEDPQVVAREIITTEPSVEREGWRTLGPALKLRNAPGQLVRPAPELGEHNQEVYGELGIQLEEISELTDKGVL